tara:strand:- start:532 stop:729 length:198 start_codon:yes stop_codon:yes gene_type:complete
MTDLQSSIDNIVERHSDSMSYDNPENHWWYADHMESLADDLKVLFKSFYENSNNYEIRVIDGDPK